MGPLLADSWYNRDIFKPYPELLVVATLMPKFLKPAVPSDDPDLGTGYYEVVQRTFKIANSAFAGQTVQQFEDAAKAAGRRLYLTNVRHDGVQLEHDDRYQKHVLLVGDTVVLSGLRDSVVEYDPERMIGPETDDVALLDYETEHLHVIVNKKKAGAETTTAAFGAVNEAAKSSLATLGYTVPYAVSNVLLTIWGSVIVLLNH